MVKQRLWSRISEDHIQRDVGSGNKCPHYDSNSVLNIQWSRQSKKKKGIKTIRGFIFTEVKMKIKDFKEREIYTTRKILYKSLI